MAATSLDVSMDTDEDGKGGPPSGEDGKKDPKKRKFGLFGPLKRLVRGSKKARSAKAEPVVGSYKAKNVTPAQAENSEDDDDGGFRLMVESRSISEGSVFKPESKEPRVDAIKKGAVSVDDINKSLQPSRVTEAATSDSSLISTDGSDNERGPLFNSGWQASGVTIRTEITEEGKENMESINFDDIQVEASQSLQNQAAKDKINIRQVNKRKPSFKARRKTAIATPPMPRVKEESPTKVSEEHPKQQTKSKDDIKVTVEHVVTEDSETMQLTKDDSKTSHVAFVDVKHKENVSKTSTLISSQPISIPARTSSPESPMDEHSPIHLSSSPISQSMLREVKLRPRPSSMREERKIEMDDGHDSEFSKTFEKVKRFSLLKDEPTADPKPVSVVESERETPKVEVSIDKAKPQRPSEVKENTKPQHNLSDMKFVLKKEPLKTSKRTDVEISEKSEITSVGKTKMEIESAKHSLHHVEGKVTSVDTKKDVLKSYTDITGKKMDITEEKNSEKIAESKMETKTTKDIDKLRERSTKIDSSSAVRPHKPIEQKEEYKLRREHRSKTLPAQPVSKEVLEKTTPNLSQTLKESKPKESLSHRFNESKPLENTPQSFKDSKPWEKYPQGLKESKISDDKPQRFREIKPREDVKENKPVEKLSQSLKENKPREDLSQSLKENKTQDFVSQSMKESKPPVDLSQNLKDSKSSKETIQTKSQELMSQDRKSEKETTDSPGKNVSKALSKRVEPKRLSWMGPGTSSEPVWVTRVKMKEAEEEKESVKDMKNNVNNMESKSKVTPVTAETPKTPLSTASVGREKIQGSSTEKSNIGSLRLTSDGSVNKNKSADPKPSTENSQTSSVKRNIFEKDKDKEVEKVPAWRANLMKSKRDQQKDVKIEIIDKSKTEVKVLEKKEEKPTSNVLREKTVGKSQDIASHRSSKVSEIAKNFQTNLQVS